jgi:hypothetical protein
MIEMLDGFADSTVAARAVGRVTRQDYESILIPRIEAVAKIHSKLRCYYEISGDFAGMEPGAMWEDLKVGVEYWMRWERIAVVTDVGWIAHIVDMFRFLMPSQVRVFPISERAAALAWIDAT